MKRELAFSAEYDRRYRALHGGTPDVVQVIRKLRENAEEGDVRSAEIYLKWAGELGPKDDSSDDEYEQLSDDELRKRLAAFL